MKHRAHIAVPFVLLGAMLLPLSAAGLQSSATDADPSLDPGFSPPETEQPKLEAPQLRGRFDVSTQAESAQASIQGIEFVGSEVPENVALAAEAFLGQPADEDTLKALAAAMSEAYQDSPVALFSLAIPAQDLSRGVVRVHVAEGYVKQAIIRKDGEVTESPLISGYVEPLIGQQPASSADYERALSLVRRVPGLKVKPRLGTTKEQGATNLILDIEPRKNRFYAGFDSRESRLIDTGRIAAGGTVYGLLREGDKIAGQISVATDGQQARSAQLTYLTPVGLRGTMLDLAAVYQETRPDTLPIEGDATRLAASLTHPILLDFKHEVSASLRIDHTMSSNAAFGSIIANDEVTAARLGLSARKSAKTRLLSGSVLYSRGVDIEGAETSTPGASLDFGKLGGTARLVQKFGERTFLRASMTGQWSNDTLPANERFLIGGANFGRGFRNGLVAFDTGYAGLIEPAYRPLSEGDFKLSEIYAFADYGGGSLNAIGTELRDITLGSAGLGVRLKWKTFASLGLEMAQPFEQPVPGLEDDPIYSLTWSFKYQPGEE